MAKREIYGIIYEFNNCIEVSGFDVYLPKCGHFNQLV